MAENQVPVSTPKRVMSDVARPQQQTPTTKSKRIRPRINLNRHTLSMVGVGLLVLLLVFFVIRDRQQQKKINKLSNPQAVAQQEQSQLVEQVGKLTDLPKNENPTVATVSDVNKLKDQPFFSNAQNGDKVLIYSQSKQAILYRPSTNKVIQISTVNLGQQ